MGLNSSILLCSSESRETMQYKQWNNPIIREFYFHRLNHTNGKISYGELADHVVCTVFCADHFGFSDGQQCQQQTNRQQSKLVVFFLIVANSYNGLIFFVTHHKGHQGDINFPCCMLYLVIILMLIILCNTFIVR